VEVVVAAAVEAEAVVEAVVDTVDNSDVVVVIGVCVETSGANEDGETVVMGGNVGTGGTGMSG